MGSFDELRKRVVELEKSAKLLPYRPPDDQATTNMEIRHLPFYALRTELDKIYKVRAAKKYLK
ncbi:MAG: hypothetical protein N3G76_01380 [Candidatus Micrarchaeota archaeon]|nr:hypothetical protein [Candidatus Micrarchaeota archaeon]